jgi:ElaB/YqjD/DUF883 family membrane-anchored ribosome-binding protein
MPDEPTSDIPETDIGPSSEAADKLSESKHHATQAVQDLQAASSHAADKLNDGKGHAAQAVQDLRAAAEAKAAEFRATAEAKAAEFRATAESKVDELRGKAEHAYTEARTRAETFRGESEQWIRENPTRAVLTAMGVGFVIGLMFRK